MKYDVTFLSDHGQEYSVFAIDETDIPDIIEKKRQNALYKSEDVYGNLMVVDLSKVVGMKFTKRKF